MLVVSYQQSPDLKATVANAFEECQKLLIAFQNFCTDEPRVNFTVPNRIGIGISRGSACRLESGGKTLDYSGHVLNLAARLMDLARPGGIVFSVGLGIELLPEATRKEFKQDKVYLRGVAERESVDVFFDPRFTSIPESAHQPLDIKWKRQVARLTLGKLKRLAKEGYSEYTIELDNEPTNKKEITVTATWDLPIRLRKYAGNGEVVVNKSQYDYEMRYGTQPCISLHMSLMIKSLAARVTTKQDVQISVAYPAWAKTDLPLPATSPSG